MVMCLLYRAVGNLLTQQHSKQHLHNMKETLSGLLIGSQVVASFWLDGNYLRAKN